MAVSMPNLPFSKKALEPVISEQTLEFHHGKHHKGYVDKTNAQIEGGSLDKANLEEIVLNSDKSLYNVSAQSWNHDFYWKGMCAPTQSSLPGDLKKEIEKAFGSLDSFKEKFNKEALGHFGSGWAWLIKTKGGELKITSTHDAHTPLKEGHKPLLTCDVWEHAYYLDYKNNRGGYLDGFWKIVNWNFVSQNLF